MQPLVFEQFSSNDHNGFLEDCSITLIDKTNGADPTRREEYWRRVLKTVMPYGLNKVDWLFHLDKLINSYTLSCIFQGKGVSIIKYILLAWLLLIFVVCIFRFHMVFLGFVCRYFIIIIKMKLWLYYDYIMIILLLLLLSLLVLFLISLLLLLLLLRIVLFKVVSTFLLLQRFYSGVILVPCARCVCNFVFLFVCLS